MSRPRVSNGSHAPGKIFGIGLSRTATLSLTEAMKALGFRALHYPSDRRTQREFFGCFNNPRAETLRLSVLERYDALTDIPVAYGYRLLDKAYPNSRFILTVRDKESWLVSCEDWWEHVVSPMMRAHKDRIFVAFMIALNIRVYGTVQYERDAFSRAYDQHHDGVRAYFSGREHDLLYLDICGGEGWSKLASFLDREQPPVPFPFANRFEGAEIRARDA